MLIVITHLLPNFWFYWFGLGCIIIIFMACSFKLDFFLYDLLFSSDANIVFLFFLLFFLLSSLLTLFLSFFILLCFLFFSFFNSSGSNLFSKLFCFCTQYVVFFKCIESEAVFIKIEMNKKWNINFSDIQCTYFSWFYIRRRIFEISLLIWFEDVPLYFFNVLHFISPLRYIFSFEKNKHQTVLCLVAVEDAKLAQFCVSPKYFVQNFKIQLMIFAI